SEDQKSILYSINNEFKIFRPERGPSEKKSRKRSNTNVIYKSPPAKHRKLIDTTLTSMNNPGYTSVDYKMNEPELTKNEELLIHGDNQESLDNWQLQLDYLMNIVAPS